MARIAIKQLFAANVELRNEILLIRQEMLLLRPPRVDLSSAIECPKLPFLGSSSFSWNRDAVEFVPTLVAVPLCEALPGHVKVGTDFVWNWDAVPFVTLTSATSTPSTGTSSAATATPSTGTSPAIATPSASGPSPSATTTPPTVTSSASATPRAGNDDKHMDDKSYETLLTACREKDFVTMATLVCQLPHLHDELIPVLRFDLINFKNDMKEAKANLDQVAEDTRASAARCQEGNDALIEIRDFASRLSSNRASRKDAAEKLRLAESMLADSEQQKMELEATLHECEKQVKTNKLLFQLKQQMCKEVVQGNVEATKTLQSQAARIYQAALGSS